MKIAPPKNDVLPLNVLFVIEPLPTLKIAPAKVFTPWFSFNRAVVDRHHAHIDDRSPDIGGYVVREFASANGERALVEDRTPATFAAAIDQRNAAQLQRCARRDGEMPRGIAIPVQGDLISAVNNNGVASSDDLLGREDNRRRAATIEGDRPAAASQRRRQRRIELRFVTIPVHHRVSGHDWGKRQHWREQSNEAQRQQKPHDSLHSVSLTPLPDSVHIRASLTPDYPTKQYPHQLLLTPSHRATPA